MRVSLLSSLPLASLLLAGPLCAAPRPSLVVVISVDQFSAELMARWGREWPGGLGRLAKEGTLFVSAYHDHGLTETGPGHSVLLSGRHPAHTGICENRWLDRSTATWTYCVNDPASPVLGASHRFAGPRNFQGSTLGQWLRSQVPQSRSYAITGKDRSAILMAGPQADGVYWFEPEVGFTTSRTYAAQLPAWLQAYDQRLVQSLSASSFFWEALSGQPEPGGSFVVRDKPLTMGLPRLVHGVGMAQDRPFWDRLRASPFYDQMVLDAAQELIAQEKLGKGNGTDLLALGLSATDYVGHAFGNQGPEMRDQLRRLDRALGRFLDRLSDQVPRLWVVLTGDHGCGDFPERLATQGHTAKRIEAPRWGRALDEAVCRTFKVKGPLFHTMDGGSLYLNEANVRAAGLAKAEVLKAAAEEARKLDDVLDAVSADELGAMAFPASADPAAHSLRERLRLSYVPGRSADLFIVFKPSVMVDDGATLCCHGHPHDMDRRVPLAFWGPWKAEMRPEPVRTVDLAATLAQELGLRPAEALDGKALALKPR
ncbi:MAG: alkaline phosphatase family protein [Firmicutes bacterium]|nr:alkaline phosphatase family protein [Bacillota bacterium]